MAIIKVDTGEISKFLTYNLGEKLPDSLNTRKLVSDIADYVSGYMKVRTSQGKNVDLGRFAPYVPRTKKSRSKRGRQVSFVDLIDKGQMLGALGNRVVNDTEAKVGFFDSIQNRKAVHHQFGTKYLPVRKFFGVSSNDKVVNNSISKLIKDAMDQALKLIKK